ncbi:hypothetical protein Tco_0726406 [Tanacetum coccineum]|uniref:Uncharacterized protein n=1 Tax=Tanacetum coccineum TaxID=301880 RepID=A0ABQ4YHS1_9ASTR
MNSKSFRVYNIRTRKVEENLHIRFLEDKPIIEGTEESIGAGHSSKETGSSQDYILMPLWKDGSLFDSSSKNASNDEPQPSSDAGKKDDEGVTKESGFDDQERPENSTQDVNTAGTSINTASINVNTGSLNINTVSPTVTTTLEATHADFFDHSLDHVIGDVQSGVQKRRITKTTNEQGFISSVYEGKTHKDLHTCLFACFLSQVWSLVDLPHVKRAIGNKWVYMNKKDERVTPKVSHLHAVKKIFRYLKGQPILGLWYPKDSPFDLEAYTNSDYAGASLDRKSIIGGCQFLGSRLILWQCKKQTVVANSTTEAYYVAAATANDEIQVSVVGLTFYWAQLFRVKDQHTQQESVVPQPRSPTQTYVADEAASTCMDVRYGGAVTTITGLEAGQGQWLTMIKPYHAPEIPSPKMESLETDLKQTKLTYGAAYTKLIKNVKKLKNKVKSNQARRRARIVVFDNEEDLEDPSNQGRKISEIDQDPTILLVQHDAEIQGRQEHDMEFEFDLDAAKDVSTAEEDISTAKPVSTAGAAVTTASVDVSTATVSTAKDKGKGIMEESEPVQTKTKLQQEQERLGYEAALRLQAELEEEERQRIASVQEAASSFNIEEWDDIQARVEADEELAQRLQAEEREKYSEAEKARLLAELINQRKSGIEEQSYSTAEVQKEMQKRTVSEKFQRDKRLERSTIYTEGARKYWKIIRVGNHTEVYQFFDDMLKAFDREDLVKLWSLVKEKFNSTEPTEDKEREIWVELKRLFEPDTDDELWKLQKYIHNLTWRLYDSCGVHHVSTEKGIDIYMLIEKEYPLSRGTLTQMLVAKLLVEQDNEMSRELLRKIFMQVERPRR